MFLESVDNHNLQYNIYVKFSFIDFCEKLLVRLVNLMRFNKICKYTFDPFK